MGHIDLVLKKKSLRVDHMPAGRAHGCRTETPVGFRAFPISVGVFQPE